MGRREKPDKIRMLKMCGMLTVEILLAVFCIYGILRGNRTVLEGVLPEQLCSLTPGIYDVWYEYEVEESNVNALTILDANGWEMGKRANLTMLHAGVEKVRTRLWLFHSTETLYVHLDQIGQPKLEIRNITFVRTNRGSCIALLIVCMFSVVLNLYLAGKRRGWFAQFGVGQRGTVAVLTLAVIIAAAPAFMAKTILGHDVGFHTLRLEGLVCGWQDGYFPVRIQPGWVYGNGYAVSVYYNDLFLVVPALLMWLGFTLTLAYSVYILLVNIATVWIAYVCFRKWFQSGRAALIGSVAYLLFPYRLYDIYVRMAVGEYTALTFLPLVAYGLYLIFTQEPEGHVCREQRDEKKTRRYKWLPLCLGLSGIVSSHVLTGEMVGFAIICLCLVMARRTLKRSMLMELIKAAGMTILLNLWYLLPFVDYFLTEEIYLGGENWKQLQYHMVYESALYPVQILQAFYGKDEAKGIGIVLAGALLAYGCLWAVGIVRRQEKRERLTGKIALLFAVFFLWMATVYFPWRELQEAGGITEYLVQSIQFPFRWLGLAGCLCAVLLCSVLCSVEKEKLIPNRALFFGAVYIMILLSAGYQTGKIINESDSAGYYSGDVLGKNGLGTREYLPIETNLDMISYRWPETSANVSLESGEKEPDSLRARIVCSNFSTEAGYVDVPLLHYRGYRAEDALTGKELTVINNGTGNVRVIVPGGYEGTIKVGFREPWYWRAAELVSLIMLAAVAFTVCRRHVRAIRPKNVKGTK